MNALVEAPARRRLILVALVFGLIAPPAFAQEKPEKPTVKKPARGALPPPRVNLPAKPIRSPLRKDADQAGGKSKGKTGTPAVAQRPDLKSRRSPPGVTAASEKKDLPKWQTEGVDEEKGEPTLSADFIKNCARLKPGVKVNLDIYDEELEAVVKLIACMTGQNIILAKSLKSKKITIYSPRKVTSREAYRAFLTALEANGFTISKQGQFLRIIEIKDYARTSDPILTEDRSVPNEDRMITQIIQLKHIDAAEMNDVMGNLTTSHASVIVYQPTNSLIITELAANLRRLKTLIDQLDVPGGQEELWVYQVLNADAADIAGKITEIFEQESAGSAPKATPRAASKTKRGKAAATTGGSSKVGDSELDAKVGKVMADERTNRLLIVATRRSYRKIKALIQKLDIAIPGDGQIHIMQLNHAKASELSSVLSNLSSEAANRRNSSANRRSTARRSSNATPAASGGNSAALFEGEVSITADEATNSLVVTASLKDFLALKRVVDELDQPRRQVFIEAVIMEVTITGNRSWGVNLHAGGGGPDIAGEKTTVAFNSQSSSAVSTLNFAQSISALTGIGMAADLEIAGFGVPPFGVMLQALAESNDVNVLSAPHILTTDNEEAEIVIGTNEPFLTTANSFGGSSALSSLAGIDASQLSNLSGLSALGVSGLGAYGPQVTREDVALTLRITPRINAQNAVTLEIDQEIEEVTAISETLGPTTSKRQVKTTVVVGDQKTVVIGGLQKTRQRANDSGIPILSEIPVLGFFFRNSIRDNERVNLLLMLTPYVIEGPEDFREIFKRKMEEHREFVARFRQEGGQYVLGLDYGKKHGMLESIHQSIEKVRDEEAMLEEIRRREQGPPLPQELDGLDAPDADGESASAEPIDWGEAEADPDSVPVRPVPGSLTAVDGEVEDQP